jgi:hypothetical protein
LLGGGRVVPSRSITGPMVVGAVTGGGVWFSWIRVTTLEIGLTGMVNGITTAFTEVDG